jgi:hypothetical protein
MKMIGLEETTLDACVTEAQHERVVVMRDGEAIALIVGVAGMDEEQLRLGSSDKFWRLITERRGQQTINRAELERRLDAKQRRE